MQGVFKNVDFLHNHAVNVTFFNSSNGRKRPVKSKYCRRKKTNKHFHPYAVNVYQEKFLRDADPDLNENSVRLTDLAKK